MKDKVVGSISDLTVAEWSDVAEDTLYLAEENPGLSKEELKDLVYREYMAKVNENQV
ncbi:hypothetical protein [Gracilibacillus salinarum]|uniref:Uncharacterized protein n=1 Tax=Gracilibacillus salinarum TaxID=2932255 RepID=A0ABY4GP90_9BACI|nr:hypothetical protein [Gracilibacillus salinarum]UOQ85547.1 hypothetical protein MUN87_01180 [Gracilibacillus salinarum]